MSTYFAILFLAAVSAYIAAPRAELAAVRRRVSAGVPQLPEQSDLTNSQPVDPGWKSRPLTLLASLVAVGLAVVAGLRWRVGTDFVQYAYIYDHEYRFAKLSDLNPLGEPGLRLISMLAFRVCDDAATMFVIAAVITVGLSVVTIYKSTPYFALAVVLYILSTAWQGSFNGVRQYLACAIIFAGHHFILQRRWKAYVLVVAVASLFHVSAVVLILLYWVPRRRISVVAVIFMLTAATLALNAYPYFAEVVDAVRGSGYSEVDYLTESVNPLRVAAAFAPSLLYFALSDRNALTSRGHFYGNMMFIHGIVFLSAIGSAYVARFAIYTGIFIAVAVPTLINMKNPLDRRFITIFVFAAYGVLWYVETTTTSSLLPFTWVFER